MKKIEKKTKKMMDIEYRFGVELEEILRQMYVDEGLSVRDIALKIGTTYAITHDWIKRAGIYSRRLDLSEK